MEQRHSDMQGGAFGTTFAVCTAGFVTLHALLDGNPTAEPAPGAAWQMHPQDDLQIHAASVDDADGASRDDDQASTSVQDAKHAAQRLVDAGYDGGKGQGAVCDARVEHAPTSGL